jgi:hypothetical protein
MLKLIILWRDPADVPEMMSPVVPLDTETVPAPAIVLKFKALPVLFIKTPKPLPELVAFVTTALPDRFKTLRALMVGATIDVVPDMVDPVTLVALIVVSVAIGDEMEVKPLTVEATSVVPLMLVPVKLVALIVVVVINGEVIDVVFVIV